MSQGILSTIGNTPLIRLDRFLDASHVNLYAKLELFNPGGSIKDRPAYSMLTEAMKKGEINPETTIVESSSGNLGVGLAQVCSYLGIRFVCVVDSRTSLTNVRIMEAYGAQIDWISEPDPEVGTFLAARIKRVRQLLETIPNSFNCNQYMNLNNPRAHYQTMQEIVDVLDGQQLDYIFCATSTCGTLRGCAEYTRDHQLDTKIIAVDAVGSVIFGDTPKPRLIPGHGSGVKPPLYQSQLETKSILVSDLDCVVGCRQLLKRESVLGGGSTGAVMSAVQKMAMHLPAGANCVAIVCDRGERYVETIYSNDWVCKHFGDVSHLWS